jgi:threonine/homoserine/homoserine lactone efflux protein
LVSIAPAIASPDAELPYAMLIVIIACIAINAVVWICLASAMTMKGNLMDAIRNE